MHERERRAPTGGEYVRGDERGHGAFWTVHDGARADTGERVTLWVFDPHAARALTAPQGQEQLARLRALSRHPRVLCPRETFTAAAELCAVLEAVDAPTLADAAAAGPLRPTSRAVDVALAVIEAARAVREAGLRPVLTPARVLLLADAPARLVVEPEASPDQLGAAAAFDPLAWTGTLTPESVLGEGDPDAPPADVFAVGALLHHALAGHPPFRVRVSVRELPGLFGAGPPPLPADVAPALRGVVADSLARSPAARPPDLAALARRLVDARREAAPPS